jgi:lycopene cyclase domain-containing protein
MPFVLSFDKKVRFYKNFKPLFVSICLSGIIFIVWDYFATARGDWYFNSEYILGIKLFKLPLEELLFFITAPFSCIFIYECVRYYIKEKTLNISHWWFKGVTAFAIALGLYILRSYTTIVLVFFGLLILIVQLTEPALLRSKKFWIFIAISYIPFVIVNYFLTSLPVVEYNGKRITGLMVTTIPIEDFVYSFCLLTLNVLIYTKCKKFFDKSPI